MLKGLFGFFFIRNKIFIFKGIENRSNFCIGSKNYLLDSKNYQGEILTKIFATLGPSSNTYEKISMNKMPLNLRFNFYLRGNN